MKTSRLLGTALSRRVRVLRLNNKFVRSKFLSLLLPARFPRREDNFQRGSFLRSNRRNFRRNREFGSGRVSGVVESF